MVATLPPTRPEVLAFLQDIKAHPEDDTVRLILADWLTDHDDPRGEFLRLQCQLARMSPTDPARPASQERVQELRSRHEQDWLGPLRTLADAIEFRRGLLALRARPDVFLGPAGQALAGSETLAWVQAVSFQGEPDL